MIELRQVSKKFKDCNLFANLNLSFEDGKCYGLVGQNGSGKSVLLRLIAGFSKPDSGQVIIDGEALGVARDFIADAGVSINQPEFLGAWTGLENLNYLAAIRKKIDEARILSWVRRFGMEEVINKKYRTYSQGMRQKMRIIQALMENPKYLLLDEPFNALDEKSAELALEIFQAFKSPQSTLIFTSHHPEDIERLSDEIIAMNSLRSDVAG